MANSDAQARVTQDGGGDWGDLNTRRFDATFPPFGKLGHTSSRRIRFSRRFPFYTGSPRGRIYACSLPLHTIIDPRLANRVESTYTGCFSKKEKINCSKPSQFNWDHASYCVRSIASAKLTNSDIIGCSGFGLTFKGMCKRVNARFSVSMAGSF